MNQVAFAFSKAPLASSTHDAMRHSVIASSAPTHELGSLSRKRCERIVASGSGTGVRAQPSTTACSITFFLAARRGAVKPASCNFRPSKSSAASVDKSCSSPTPASPARKCPTPPPGHPAQRGTSSCAKFRRAAPQSLPKTCDEAGRASGCCPSLPANGRGVAIEVVRRVA